MDFHVHLQRGNTFGGTGNLKVHVTGKVFGISDVAQHVWRCRRPSSGPWQYQLLGAFSGTPASISAKQLEQVAAIEVEPFWLMISVTIRMVYGNSASAWQYGSQGALCQVAVADFAAAWATKAANFTNSVAWCVVVVHVAAFAFLFHGVDHLGVAQWRQCNDVHSLGHTAGKQA